VLPILRTSIPFLLVSVLVVSLGCGSEGGALQDDGPPTFDVTVKVTSGGTAAGWVTVSLVPEGDDPTQWDGETDETGACLISCPEGSYKVVLSGGTDPSAMATDEAGSQKSPVPAELTDAGTTSKTVEVKAEGENVLEVDLSAS